ncbi:hypothetical protein, partial [Acinetobacter baumannii]|uniref:hypothetical protein n=1 Tax=Acinetobacter baumannii TaxID=470 RepID=UPI00289FA3F4
NNIMRYLAFMVVATYWLHGYIFNFLGYILATFTGIKKAAYEPLTLDVLVPFLFFTYSITSDFM